MAAAAVTRRKYVFDDVASEAATTAAGSSSAASPLGASPSVASSGGGRQRVRAASGSSGNESARKRQRAAASSSQMRRRRGEDADAGEEREQYADEYGDDEDDVEYENEAVSSTTSRTLGEPDDGFRLKRFPRNPPSDVPRPDDDAAAALAGGGATSGGAWEPMSLTASRIVVSRMRSAAREALASDLGAGLRHERPRLAAELDDVVRRVKDALPHVRAPPGIRRDRRRSQFEDLERTTSTLKRRYRISRGMEAYLAEELNRTQDRLADVEANMQAFERVPAPAAWPLGLTSVPSGDSWVLPSKQQRFLAAAAASGSAAASSSLGEGEEDEAVAAAASTSRSTEDNADAVDGLISASERRRSFR